MAYPQSDRLFNLPNLGAQQAPDNLFYVLNVADGTNPGDQSDTKAEANDIFSIITKNITDLTVRYQDSVAAAPALSAANTGALNYNATTQTFQGSRNGSAYSDLLFGVGANTQIAYWTALQDELNGSASWTFNNTTKTVTLSHTNTNPNLIIQDTAAATPIEIRAFLAGPALQVIGFDALGNGGILRLFGGQSGPDFPLATAELGVVRFAGVNGGGVAPTTRGGGSIKYIATANLSLTEGGSGMVITATPNGTTTDITRITITGDGQCIIGANGTGVTATLGGISTKVVLGNLTTYNANAAIQCGNSALGDDNITFLIQGNAGQSEGVFRCEQSTGQTLYLIGIAGSHTYASTAVPAVSPANQGRLYYDVATQRFKISENGGAYSNLSSQLAVGNTVGSGTTGSLLFVNTGPVLAQDNTNLFFDATNIFLGIRTNTPAATLHVVCKVTSNEGIQVDSNDGTITSMWWSDGSTLFFGALTDDEVSLVANSSANIRFTDTTLGFFGVNPVAQQTMGAATAGAAYTATEQAMLQAVYDAVRNLGLGT